MEALEGIGVKYLVQYTTFKTLDYEALGSSILFNIQRLEALGSNEALGSSILFNIQRLKHLIIEQDT